MFEDPQNMAELNRLTDKILRSESQGMRRAYLVDVHHVVNDNDVVSFVVYDKDPIRTEDGALQYERRWVVVVTLQDTADAAQSWTKTRGIVSVWWEDADE